MFQSDTFLNFTRWEVRLHTARQFVCGFGRIVTVLATTSDFADLSKGNITIEWTKAQQHHIFEVLLDVQLVDIDKYNGNNSINISNNSRTSKAVILVRDGDWINSHVPHVVVGYIALVKVFEPEI